MTKNIPRHNIAYPAYFSKLSGEQLLRIGTDWAKDAEARLPVAAAAYDQGRNEKDSAITTAGRAAELACYATIELQRPSDEVQGWALRAVGALNPENATDAAESDLVWTALNEVEHALAPYLPPRPSDNQR